MIVLVDDNSFPTEYYTGKFRQKRGEPIPRTTMNIEEAKTYKSLNIAEKIKHKINDKQVEYLFRVIEIQ